MKSNLLAKLKLHLTSLWLILFFALAFVLALVLHGFDYIPWRHSGLVLKLALLFALFGAYYGSICAFDRAAGLTKVDRPLLRSLVCGALAGLIALTLQSMGSQAQQLEINVLAALIGAIFGWWGWCWARFIDF